MTPHESDRSKRGPWRWLAHLFGHTPDIGASMGGGDYPMEEQSRSERGGESESDVSYGRLVETERAFRAAVLQSRREELVSLERQLETRDGLVCESSERDARRLGKQLYRKLMIHRQPTHRDSAALRKAAAMNQVKEAPPSVNPPTVMPTFRPPTQDMLLRDHATHVIPRPAVR
jgi:hypothetical protein